MNTMTYKTVTRRVGGKIVQTQSPLSLVVSVNATAMPTDPSPWDMAKNFAGAITDWAKSGFKVVDESVYQHRMSVCRSCELWDGQARGGMGKCNHKSCGCSKMKHWLDTSKCPAAKW